MAEATFGSPAPRFRGLGVAVNLPDDSAGDFPSFAFLQTHSARDIEVLPPGPRPRTPGVHPQERPGDQREERKGDREHAPHPPKLPIRFHPPEAVVLQPARVKLTEHSVSGVVAPLIAQDPGARSRDQDESEQAIRVLAEMLVGAVQSVANWWAEHPEVAPRTE